MSQTDLITTIYSITILLSIVIIVREIVDLIYACIKQNHIYDNNDETKQYTEVKDFHRANRIITPEEFGSKMFQLDTQNCKGDPKYTHMDMCDLMCDTLRSLGYDDGVDRFCSASRKYGWF